MKNNIFLIISFYLVTSTALSQQLSKEFTKVSTTDFTMDLGKMEKDAPAIVLFDIGESKFIESDNSLNILFQRKRRIKILDRSGFDYGEVSVFFYQDGYGRTEYVEDLVAYTYNLENGIISRTKIDPQTIYEEQVSANWKVKKFAFPNIKVGSIIEYSYSLETPFHFKLPDWEFQSSIPTKYSSYSVSMVPFYEYIFLAQQVTSFDFQDSFESKGFGRTYGGVNFKDMTSVWVKKNVPAFTDESFISSRDDYIMKMDFQLTKVIQPSGASNDIITTWPKLNEGLLKSDNFGKYIKKSGKNAEKIISTLDLSGKNKTEKSKVILDYVKSKFSWNGHYSKYTSATPKEFMSNIPGNSANVNLFAIAMLNKAGISSKPVIISTRDHGKIRMDYPFNHFFNHVIIFVNDENTTFLADATDSQIEFGRIPPKCINGRGLVVQEKKVSWVNLYNELQSTNNRTIEFEIVPDELVANLKLVSHSKEFESYYRRRNYQNDTVKLKKYYNEKGLNNISKISTQNYSELEQPYIIKVNGNVDIERFGNKLILKPFLKFPYASNPLKKDSRKYPVDFTYSRTNSYNSIIHIPKGYSVISLPKDINIESGLASITYTSRMNGDELSIMAKVSFKKSTYSSKDYARIKYYFKMVVNKFNEEVILEKTASN